MKRITNFTLSSARRMRQGKKQAILLGQITALVLSLFAVSFYIQLVF